MMRPQHLSGLRGLKRARMSLGLVGTWITDDSDPATAPDHSGRLNHGTITGAIWAAGKQGRALSFDGVDDYVDCGNGVILDCTSAITISMLVNPGINLATSLIVSKSNADGTIRPYDVWYGGAYTKMVFAVYDGSWHAVQADTDIVIGDWYHIVATYDGTMRLYENGIRQAQSISLATLPTNTAILAIGRQGSASTGYFNGKINEVRVWNRALSAAEIWDEYINRRRRYGV